MNHRDPDLVAASEIASWAWCPESWRLQSLGHESENRAALEEDGRLHERKAAFETRSRTAVAFGWRLVAAALLLALLALLPSSWR